MVLDGDITSEITKEAACGMAGEETFTATVTFAGKTYTDSKVLATAALDHDPEVRNAKDATCTEEGYTGDTVCKRCGETLATGSAHPGSGPRHRGEERQGHHLHRGRLHRRHRV